MSFSGNMMPASIMMESCELPDTYSMIIMFLPTSPSPPSGTTRRIPSPPLASACLDRVLLTVLSLLSACNGWVVRQINKKGGGTPPQPIVVKSGCCSLSSGVYVYLQHSHGRFALPALVLYSTDDFNR